MLLVWLLLVFCYVSANMYPRPYLIANEDPSSRASYSTEYQAEFFDVYSQPIRTEYSQVYWAMQDPLPLPEEIVERFSGGKAMAVVGYEVDQVQEDENGVEVGVPITWAYNHHYLAFLVKQSKQFQYSLHQNLHNHSYNWESTNETISTSLFFSEGNGGEFRGSYHGYPKGYAQLIESPDHAHISPMQIDTWNRSSGDTRFHPGPLPSSSRIPHTAGYSGLIECPCSDRLEKKWGMSYTTDVRQCRDGEISNSTECMNAAKYVITAKNYRLREGGQPKGENRCGLTQYTNGTVDIFWGEEDMSMLIANKSTVIGYAATDGVNVTVVVESELTTITISGPSDKWFGVGFGSSSMCVHQIADECLDGGPYAITVSGESIVERRLDQHGPGRVLDASLKVQSNRISGGIRSVTLIRASEGLTEDHFSFDPATKTVPIISARGCGLEFRQHCGHSISSLYFVKLGQKTPLCRSGIRGTVGGFGFSDNRCLDEPKGDLIKQKNPTCKIESYRGGLGCCHHLKSLLDKNQENPWKGEYLEYRMKFRFYFEEYKPTTSDGVEASHKHLTRLYWETESFAGEYDVPQCQKSTPPEQCIHTITSRFQVKDAIFGDVDLDGVEGVEIIYAGPHCHAPTCLSMELYNADTGEIICHMTPVRGETGSLYDEEGFLVIPPCLWGHEEGLVKPRLIPLDTNLLSIKRSNSSLAHTGEMASWQMRAALVRSPKEKSIASAKVSALRRSSENSN